MYTIFHILQALTSTISHVLELLHPGFGVTLADLTQCLVLITALLHILSMKKIHSSSFRVIPGSSKL